jgi:hypothetical protein
MLCSMLCSMLGSSRQVLPKTPVMQPAVPMHLTDAALPCKPCIGLTQFCCADSGAHACARCMHRPGATVP